MTSNEDRLDKIERRQQEFDERLDAFRSWNEHQDDHLAEHSERIAEARERQAEALEVIAGMLMLEFDYRDDRPGYSVESLYDEAQYHGKGGEPQYGRR